MNDLVLIRLRQARESLDEAVTLLDARMDHGIVLTSLYYAFYYPIVAMLYEGRVPDAMQSMTLGLFEKQFVQTRIFNKEQYKTIRKVFDSKPDCSSVCQAVNREELDRLVNQSREFITTVEAFLNAKK
jgi:uncharacterized protein (UPF0332 family)